MQYRRSIEFLYKDKRLRNAVPPQDTDDKEAGPRFISKNPKLARILKNKEKRRLKQSEMASNNSKVGSQQQPQTKTSAATGPKIDPAIGKAFNMQAAKQVKRDNERMDAKQKKARKAAMLEKF